jgi:histidine triad (HIT) family protein
MVAHHVARRQSLRRHGARPDQSGHFVGFNAELGSRRNNGTGRAAIIACASAAGPGGSRSCSLEISRVRVTSVFGGRPAGVELCFTVMVRKSCPLCSYTTGGFTHELIVHEDHDVLVVPCLDQKRNNRGHCLVFTRLHIPNIYELPNVLAAPVLQAVSATALATKQAFAADGVSVRQNNDAASGQDVFHVHFHVVPRFHGDDFEAAEYQRLDEQTRIDQAETLRRAWRS